MHLCSRSFIFEPKNIDLPLMKLKFSNNLIYKQLKTIEKSKMESMYNSLLKQILNLVIKIKKFVKIDFI